jgi:hypothetical protein
MLFAAARWEISAIASGTPGHVTRLHFRWLIRRFCRHAQCLLRDTLE